MPSLKQFIEINVEATPITCFLQINFILHYYDHIHLLIKLVLTNEVIRTFEEKFYLDDDEFLRLEKQKHLEFKMNFSIIRCLNKNQVKATELLNASRTLDKEIMSQIHSGSFIIL